MLRTFESYIDLQVAHQKDMDNFPITYMFGHKTDEEIKEQLAKIGAKKLIECCSVLGCGDVVRKVDVPKLKELFALHDAERKLFTESEEHLTQMIENEMWNHEYGYTRDPYDTLAALGRSIKDFDTDEKFARCWAKAQKTVFDWDGMLKEEE
jgi:hypothetical protein